MYFSPKLKKRILLLFMLPVLLGLLGVGVLYFVMVHRFKDSLKFIVDRESKGRYAFDAGEATLSVWNKSIRLKESVLYSRDTGTADVCYRIKIHEIYFSLASWKDLLYHKKIVSDSLSITEPDITVQVRKLKERKQPAGFRPSDLMDHLESALTHFNVHSFTLKDASFTYEEPDGDVPLHGDHINLAVTNFTKVNNEDSHLLGSDKVMFSLGPQHWVFPATKHEINFSRLTFDSKGQRFEVDSFSFFQKAAIDKGEVRISADKFFFNSQHLPAIYQKEQLLLDTLICVNPVLTVVNNGREEKIKDSLQRIGPANNLFKLINVKFISVIDGRLSLQKDGRTENTAARKANLSIFNLAVDPAKDPALSTDSIRLNLKKIEFITKDSLFRLGIDEFAIRKNDVLFRNVVFEPTSYNQSDKGIMFTAPSLLLKHISIPELLHKRLVASGAELYRPLIVLSAKRKTGTTKNGAVSNAGSATKSSEAKLALFYQTLHEMSELIDAPDFNITEGTMHYTLTGIKPMELNANNLNAHILLNQLFVSDSLVDIKHAIPDLRIGGLSLVSKGLDLTIKNYRLDGVRRYNWVEQLQLKTPNGMELNGSGIYWKVFDWDIYQKTRGIHIDSLHVDQLGVHYLNPSITAGIRSRQSDSSRDLPIIRIGKLSVNKIGFTRESEKENIRFSVRNLNIDGIESIRRLFTWNKTNMTVYDIDLAGKGKKAHIGEIAFDNNKETILKELTYESEGNRASTRLSLPLLRLSIPLHSSDLSQLAIPSVVADKVDIHYTARSGKDTLQVNGSVNLQATNIQTSKDKDHLLQYGEVNADIRQIELGKGKIQLDLPEAALHLSHGQLTNNSLNGSAFSSTLNLTWKDARLRFNKDNTGFSANHLSGSFNDAAFTVNSTKKINLQQLIAGTTLSGGDLHYKGKKISADVAGVSWDPSGNALRLNNFSVIPNETLEETFKRSQWQGDYIKAKGTSLTISGIRVNRSPGDSSIHINKLILDGVAIEASRDKSIPFHHGIEKPMPTKLIAAIPLLLRADSVLLYHSSVIYNEFSVTTRKWSSIPFDDLNGVILNVNNSPGKKDTFRIFANATLFNNHIRYFSYEEAYQDPLSSFAVRSQLSPIDLTRFSQVSIPMAAVSVTRGHADTLYSDWEGNKYAATGTMNFYYNHLKVRVLDKEDIKKRSFLPVLKTWVANLILPDSRKRASAIFVERDQEKFIFNYWVKAISSGALTTVGVKRNKVYRKKYLKKYQQFSLPKKQMDRWK